MATEHRDQMQLRLEFQLNPVGDEVAALTAVIRPILRGTLYALKGEAVEDAGGHEAIKLRTLSRLYRQGDGDCGICFEYAVHDAVMRGDEKVVERIEDAMTRLCKVPGGEPASILFGAEKTGSQQLIETAAETLTDDSLLMYGTRGRPVKLKRHLDSIATAFRKPAAADLLLPYSIRGIWKADLFLGHSDTDKWVGTSVKINPTQLQPARGLRIGIVPQRAEKSDAIERRGNLVVCPLRHDADFMEIFYGGFRIVQHFFAAGATMPSEIALYDAAEREVAKLLVQRRDFPVLDVIEALGPLAQPELLQTKEKTAGLVFTRQHHTEMDAVVAPVPRGT